MKLIENAEDKKAIVQVAKDYLEQAAADKKCAVQSGEAMRLAVVRFILDAADIVDNAQRKEIAKQFLAMPAWFGSNASAARQALGIKTNVEAIVEEFEV